MSRWSKLQNLVKGLVLSDLNIGLHCNVYRMKSQYGHTGLPRYWITLDKEIIWDYPRHFVGQGSLSPGATYSWPYATDISDISALIREYVDTPRQQLLEREFPDDRWGLIDILRAADRRIGSLKLRVLAETIDNVAAEKVLSRRLKGNPEVTPEVPGPLPVDQLSFSTVDTSA